MIQNKFSISSLFFSLALCSVLVVGVGCKGKKKIVDTTPQESSAAEQQMAKVKSALMALLNADYTSIRQVEDAERELAEIKGMGIGDTEIASLILDVEDKLARERERLSKKDAEAKAKAEKDAFNNNLNSLFNDIASASSTNIANMKIEEALNTLKKDAFFGRNVKKKLIPKEFKQAFNKLFGNLLSSCTNSQNNLKPK